MTLTLHRDGAPATARRATTAATREPAPHVVPRLRLDRGRRATAPARSGVEAELARGARAAARVPAGRGRGRRKHGIAGVLDALRAARPRACWSARRWSPRATTSPRSSWRSCRTPTRRCASPTSAPRSARSRSSRSSPGRSGRGPARRPRAGADAVPADRAACCTPPRTTRRLPRGGDGAPARAALPAVLDADRRRRRRPLTQEAADRAAATRGSAAGRGSTCSARRRSSGSRTCTAAAWS